MESFPAAQIGRPKASEFVFARLRYDSGDWDYNPKVAANVLNSLVEYTTIPVYGEEVVITRHGRPVAHLSPVSRPRQPVRPLAEFRAGMPRLRKPSAVLLREMRNEES